MRRDSTTLMCCQDIASPPTENSGARKRYPKFIVDAKTQSSPDWLWRTQDVPGGKLKLRLTVLSTSRHGPYCL